MSYTMDRTIGAIEKASEDWNSVGFYIPPSLIKSIALAAISAIREPSQAMIDAGAKKVRGGSATDCAAATWRAMVDEVLRQPEERPQPVAPPWEQE